MVLLNTESSFNRSLPVYYPFIISPPKESSIVALSREVGVCQIAKKASLKGEDERCKSNQNHVPFVLWLTANYLLKSLFQITSFKKGTLSIFTLHLLFNLIKSEIRKKPAYYILCHIILKLIKYGCVSAVEKKNIYTYILKKSYFKIQLLSLCQVRSWFCNPKPWLWHARHKNSARPFRAQSTYTFCCYIL